MLEEGTPKQQQAKRPRAPPHDPTRRSEYMAYCNGRNIQSVTVQTVNKEPYTLSAELTLQCGLILATEEGKNPTP